jgi:hypothetical protein
MLKLYTVTFAPRFDAPETRVFTDEDTARRWAAREMMMMMREAGYTDEANQVYSALCGGAESRTLFETALDLYLMCDAVECNLNMEQHELTTDTGLPLPAQPLN